MFRDKRRKKHHGKEVLFSTGNAFVELKLSYRIVFKGHILRLQ